MSEVMPFDYDGHEVRTSTDANGTLFSRVDVCAVLGIVNAKQAAARLDEDERGVFTAYAPNGVPIELAAVTEAGLYALVLTSRRPEARAFKRWITHEVLPQIRRTGAYVPEPRRELSRLELIDMAREAEVGRLAAEQRVAELAPKAEAAEVLTEAHGDFPIGAAANMLGLGRTTLFRALYAEQVIQRDKRPYQRYAHWFRVVAGTHGNRDGSETTHYTSYLTGEGLVGLHGLLVRRGYDVRRPESSLSVVAGGTG